MTTNLNKSCHGYELDIMIFILRVLKTITAFGSSGQCNTLYNFSIGVSKFNVFLERIAAFPAALGIVHRNGYSWIWQSYYFQTFAHLRGEGYMSEINHKYS